MPNDYNPPLPVPASTIRGIPVYGYKPNGAEILALAKTFDNFYDMLRAQGYNINHIEVSPIV